MSISHLKNKQTGLAEAGTCIYRHQIGQLRRSLSLKSAIRQLQPTPKAAAGTATQTAALVNGFSQNDFNNTVTCPLIPEGVRSYTLVRPSHSGWTLQTRLVGWFWNAVPTVKNKRVKAAFSLYATQLESKLPGDLRLETVLTTLNHSWKATEHWISFCFCHICFVHILRAFYFFIYFFFLNWNHFISLLLC